MDHIASNCPNLKHVMAKESYLTEEASYVTNGYRGANYYPPPRAPPPAPYHQEPTRPQVPPYDDLKSTMLDMFHRLDQKLDVNRKAQDEELQGVRAQLKGVNAHLKDIDSHIGDIDIWRKGVDSQLGRLASQIPRPQGQLPSRPDENPRGQIRDVHFGPDPENPESGPGIYGLDPVRVHYGSGYGS